MKENWLPAEEVAIAAEYPTNLSQLTKDDFDRLSRHGYETAKWNECLFS